MNSKIDLSIIIVSWNVKDLVRKCLESIYCKTRDINFEIFVTDNASRDGSAEMIANEFSDVHLNASQENLGFAKGNNWGIKQARGEFILLLNPDTEILDQALDKMVEFMRQHAKIGLAACKLLNPDHTLQPSVRRFPSFVSQFLVLTKFQYLWPNSPVIRRYLAKDFDYQKEQEIDQAMGAFLLVRKEIFEKVGLLDENYWIWFEEVDFCKKVKAVNYQIVYTPKTQIIHHFGQSFGQLLNLERQSIFNKSLLYYFRKHHPWWQYFTLLILTPWSLLTSFILQILKIKKFDTK